jgi:TrkA domain protein
MSTPRETPLPGIGMRYDFNTMEGNQLGLIEHRTGRKDLIVYNPEDPDSCQISIRLSEDDSSTLAGLLGVTPEMEEKKREALSVSGITIDWLPIQEAWPCAGHMVKSAELHAKTGVMIIALVRDGETIPVPAKEFQVNVGDTLVVVGTTDHIEQAFAMVQEANEAVCT